MRYLVIPQRPPGSEALSPDQLARLVQGDDRRDGEASRDDRGVRGDPADVGDEARELVPLEQDHVGRRQVVRNHDQFVTPLVRTRTAAQLSWPAQQCTHHPFHHLQDVVLTLAQIGVLDLVELAVGDDVVLITKDGMVTRSKVDAIRIVGRNTQGVRVMNLSEGDKIVSVALVEADNGETPEPSAEGSGEGA